MGTLNRLGVRCFSSTGPVHMKKSLQRSEAPEREPRDHTRIYGVIARLQIAGADKAEARDIVNRFFEKFKQEYGTVKVTGTEIGEIQDIRVILNWNYPLEAEMGRREELFRGPQAENNWILLNRMLDIAAFQQEASSEATYFSTLMTMMKEIDEEVRQLWNALQSHGLKPHVESVKQ